MAELLAPKNIIKIAASSSVGILWNIGLHHWNNAQNNFPLWQNIVVGMSFYAAGTTFAIHRELDNKSIVHTVIDTAVITYLADSFPRCPTSVPIPLIVSSFFAPLFTVPILEISKKHPSILKISTFIPTALVIAQLTYKSATNLNCNNETSDDSFNNIIYPVLFSTLPFIVTTAMEGTFIYLQQNCMGQNQHAAGSGV